MTKIVSVDLPWGETGTNVRSRYHLCPFEFAGTQVAPLQDKPRATLARSRRGSEADKAAETTLEEAFEVFARGTLADEDYVLDDVSGKRIAISPAVLRAKYRTE